MNKLSTKIKHFALSINLTEVAFKIFKEKPIYGIGYNTPATKYLPMDYVPIIHLHEPWSKTYNSFYRGFMGSNGVLDNIFLTFLVEMGGPFFLLYFGSLFYLILFARRVGEKNKYFRPEMILFFVFLSGFLVNAMVFDILKYPSRNWIFHSILGVLFVQSIEGNRVLRKDVADNRNSGDCLSTCV